MAEKILISELNSLLADENAVRSFERSSAQYWLAARDEISYKFKALTRSSTESLRVLMNFKSLEAIQ